MKIQPLVRYLEKKIYLTISVRGQKWYSKLKSNANIIKECSLQNLFSLFSGEKVVRKWTCLRDLFAKLNKDKVSKKSCSAIKKLHFDQLQFLHKIYHEPNNKQGNKENIEPQLQASGSVLDDCTSLVQNSAYTPKGRKHEELDEFDLNISKALEEEKVCSNMTFLLSLMPCLQTFDDQTFLQFQMEVLKIIKNINEEVNPSNSTPDHSQL